MKKNMPLVTLLCPCYNAEEYLESFLDSLLKQTYKNIQFIMIDDGSSDNTLSILNKYKSKFNNFNEYYVIRKKNGGAASAVSEALKFVKGKYLCWADCDDILSKNNVDAKVDFLEKNLDCALVLGGAIAVDFETKKQLYTMILPDEQKDDDLFYRLIYPGVPCYPGVFMIRCNVLFSNLKEKKIPYNKNVGQNWQLLLPVAYKNKCGYINDYIYDYSIRMNSHSRNKSFEIDFERTFYQEKLLLEIIEFVKDDKEKKDVVYNITRLINIKRLDMSFSNWRKNEFINTFNYCLKNNIILDDIYYKKKIVISSKLLFMLYKLMKKIKWSV